MRHCDTQARMNECMRVGLIFNVERLGELLRACSILTVYPQIYPDMKCIDITMFVQNIPYTPFSAIIRHLFELKFDLSYSYLHTGIKYCLYCC